MTSLLSAVSRRDLVASLGVFVIAVPLSLGIALASGAPASAAIITAIVGGIVVGLMAGAPLVVSGPAAGLAALTFHYIQQFGLRGLAFITIGAGLVQIALGAMRLGKIFTFVPKSVLAGMLAAIGAIILVGQIHVLLGRSVPSSVAQALLEFPAAVAALMTDSRLLIIAGLGLLAIVVQLVWPKLGRRVQWLPGALPAVALATLLALSFDVPRVALVSITEDIARAVSHWSLSSLSWVQLPHFLVPAIALALVASAETLLTARAVDELAADRGLKLPKASLDRELIAQGVGNTTAGALGGLPMTGVIVRSAANINFGATSRWSAVLHGVWIVLAVAAFPHAMAAIPLTALAAVLVVTGFKLVNLPQVVATFKGSRYDGFLWATTFTAILSTDLLRGLGIALFVSAAGHFIMRKSRVRPDGLSRDFLTSNDFLLQNARQSPSSAGAGHSPGQN